MKFILWAYINVIVKIYMNSILYRNLYKIYTVQETGIKTIPKKKKRKKAKWLSEEALQIAVKKKKQKAKEKRKDIPIWMQSSKE